VQAALKALGPVPSLPPETPGKDGAAR